METLASLPFALCIAGLLCVRHFAVPWLWATHKKVVDARPLSELREPPTSHGVTALLLAKLRWPLYVLMLVTVVLNVIRYARGI